MTFDLITFRTSPPKYAPKIVAEVEFQPMAWISKPTTDRRRLRRGLIEVLLPAPVMTDYGKGPRRPGVSELAKYRQIGVLLAVSIDPDRMTGWGHLYERLPEDVLFWPAIDIAAETAKTFKNGRIDMVDWKLRAVTLHDRRSAWPDLPPARITPRNT